MAFRVGQKVVCISKPRFEDNRLRPGGKYVPIWPIVGQTYTVRGLADGPARPHLFLEEIINPVCRFAEGFYEMGWNPIRFRPLVERKTDISIFKAMLNSAKEPAI